MLSQPAQKLKAINAGHFQVRQDEVRQWKFGAISKIALTGQVADCLFSMPNGLYRKPIANLFRSVLDEKGIMLVIFGQQDD